MYIASDQPETFFFGLKVETSQGQQNKSLYYQSTTAATGRTSSSEGGSSRLGAVLSPTARPIGRLSSPASAVCPAADGDASKPSSPSFWSVYVHVLSIH
jgi:hypothetical protein